MQVLGTYPRIEAALVSTNSITQGEQVAALWPHLKRLGLVINFAHRPFVWTSEAKGKAAVHCVIIGFATKDRAVKTIYAYPEPHLPAFGTTASHINAYLLDHADVYLPTRTSPITNALPMRYGSKPVDGSGAKRTKGIPKTGNLVLTNTEREDLIKREPSVRAWLRPFVGSEELINGETRWCLWLIAASPKQISGSPSILRRLEKVREFRANSTKAPTQAAAATPSLFGEIRQPRVRYLAVPEVSSERRGYIPCAFLDPDVIASNLLYTVEGAGLFEFGILMSRMHMAWVRTVCGRLESRFRYSAGIAYNNLPWPSQSEKQKVAIGAAAQAVLNERARHTDSNLATLYGQLSMPPDLAKAHAALDRAVDVAYGRTQFKSELERVAFLFTQYEKLTSLFPTEAKPKRRKHLPA